MVASKEQSPSRIKANRSLTLNEVEAIRLDEVEAIRFDMRSIRVDMRSIRVSIRTVLIAVGLAIITACNGGAGLSVAPKIGQGAPTASAAGLTVAILVPPRATLASSRPHTDYFSPATQSVVISAVGPSPSKTSVIAYVNVSATNPACTGYDATTCDVTLPLSVSGRYLLKFLAYDHTQTSNKPPFIGRQLATNETQLAYLAGVTKAYSVTLDGIPAYFAVSPNGNDYLQGSRDGLTLYGSSTQEVIIESLDKSGDPIIGPGAPSLSVTSSGVALDVIPLGVSHPNIFNISAQMSRGAVSPGYVSLTATASQPIASGAGTATTTIPVHILHSVIAVASANGVSEYYDGNTMPTLVIPQSGQFVLDSSGNIFMVGPSAVNEYPAGSTTPTLSIDTTTLCCNNQVAVDAPGNVYISEVEDMGKFSVGYVNRYAPGQTTNPTVVATVPDGGIGAYSAYMNSLNGFAADASGGLFLSFIGVVIIDNQQEIYGSEGAVLSPACGEIDFPLNGRPYPGAIAGDGSGNTYVVLQNATGNTIGEYSPTNEYSTCTVSRTLTGLGTPNSIAVDVAGTVYVADSAKGGVLEFASGATTPGFTLKVSGAASIVAVLPSSILNH